MKEFDIAIVNGTAVSYSENHVDIEAARAATIRKALDMLLEEAPPVRTLVADCSIMEAHTNDERSFSVTLAVRDHI